MNGLQPRTVSPHASLFSQLNSLDTQYWVTHICNSIHLQWIYFMWHDTASGEGCCKSQSPCCAPAHPFPCGYSLAQVWGTLVSLLKAKCSCEHTVQWACLKTPPRLRVPEKNKMSGYHMGQGMREAKLFPQQCMQKSFMAWAAVQLPEPQRCRNLSRHLESPALASSNDIRFWTFKSSVLEHKYTDRVFLIEI